MEYCSFVYSLIEQKRYQVCVEFGDEVLLLATSDYCREVVDDVVVPGMVGLYEVVFGKDPES